MRELPNWIIKRALDDTNQDKSENVNNLSETTYVVNDKKNNKYVWVRHYYAKDGEIYSELVLENIETMPEIFKDDSK